MIESCTQKRMLLAITILGGLTLLVLVLESHLTAGNSRNHATAVKNVTSDCILREEFSVVEPCHPCTDFEITSRSIGACLPSHFKEVLKCSKTGTTVVRSCDKVTWLEERNFWLFEGLMFALGLVSSTIVYARQKILDHRMLRRIQRQLASGV
ncbi:hypothetical protein R5R35_006808 [Gryllus longicercus]|uniref:Protein JTB n=1 Tax=Gryllus longicercus TaxID=2509291 RepID=A0AAN9VEJ3_9ORTH